MKHAASPTKFDDFDEKNEVGGKFILRRMSDIEKKEEEMESATKMKKRPTLDAEMFDD